MYTIQGVSGIPCSLEAASLEQFPLREHWAEPTCQGRGGGDGPLIAHVQEGHPVVTPSQ